MLKIFNCKRSDKTGLEKYDGRLCMIRGELSNTSEDGVNKLYHIQFMDGYEIDAHENELK